MSTTISAPASISAAFVPTGAGQSGNANMNANRSDINLLIRITKSNSSPFSIVLLIYRHVQQSSCSEPFHSPFEQRHSPSGKRYRSSRKGFHFRACVQRRLQLTYASAVCIRRDPHSYPLQHSAYPTLRTQHPVSTSNVKAAPSYTPFTALLHFLTKGTGNINVNSWNNLELFSLWRLASPSF